MKIITITLLCLLNFKSVSSQSLKGYQDSCDGDCDERKGLACSSTSKICECMLVNTTMYDNSRSHCVTKAGNSCRRIVTSATSTSTENLCVPHASCKAINLPCECDRSYFQTRNGTCAPVALYGQTCSSRKLCDKSAGMECVGSKSKQFQCHCKYPQDQYYDSALEKCISYSGGNCVANTLLFTCVKHATCSQDVFELKRAESLGKAYFYNATIGKKCSCILGFRQTQGRNCLPSYQSPCNDENVCNHEENLKCFDNKICLCQNPLHQVYCTEKKNCLSLIGTKCSTSTTNLNDCVDGAECEEDGVCRCKSGFTSTPSRHCLKDFGQSCGKEGDECNFWRGLSCLNATCQCFDDLMSYSSNTKTCLSGQGSPCGEFILRMDQHKKFQFMEIGSGTSDNSPVEKNALINSHSVTIECDSESGFRCQRLHGYQQCA